MDFFWDLKNTVTENVQAAVLFSVILIGLAVAWGIGCGFKSKEAYVALSFIVGGVFLIYVNQSSLKMKTIGAGLSLYGIFFGVGYLLLLALFSFKGRIQERRKRRKEIERSLKYTLPQRDNTFIRSRLNTALRDESDSVEMPTGAETIKPLKAAYIKGLVAKLKEKELSFAERLEMEDTARLFLLYLEKSRWTSEEQRKINDIFCYFLKLSAKYSV